MSDLTTYHADELRQAAAALHLSGYLGRVLRVSTSDTRLQAIADAWNEWLNAVETATDSTEVLNAWESFEKEVTALVEP